MGTPKSCLLLHHVSSHGLRVMHLDSCESRLNVFFSICLAFKMVRPARGNAALFFRTPELRAHSRRSAVLDDHCVRKVRVRVTLFCLLAPVVHLHRPLPPHWTQIRLSGSCRRSANALSPSRPNLDALFQNLRLRTPDSCLLRCTLSVLIRHKALAGRNCAMVDIHRGYNVLVSSGRNQRRTFAWFHNMMRA